MIFLDYASTCPIVKYPQQLYRDTLGEGYFFNSNANYAYKEKRLLSEVENRVKKSIGAKGGKVIFGGTSSQLIENLIHIIEHLCYRYDVLCSNYEHDSFFCYYDDLFGNMDELKGCLQLTCNDTIPIVMWQAVQNVTGEIFPTKQIGELVHQYHGFYICDGTAQIGHTPIEPNIDDWCDFWCCSGHKIGTELGIGCCWVSDRLDKWLNGFKLHGTPNLAGALAITQAVEDACDKEQIQMQFDYLDELYWALNSQLIENQIDFRFVEKSGVWNFCPAINAIRLFGFNADALQQFLASKQVYISIGGSACAERHDYRILETGYDLTKQEANEVIRISFGQNSTIEDIESLVKNICEFKKIYLDG